MNCWNIRYWGLTFSDQKDVLPRCIFHSCLGMGSRANDQCPANVGRVWSPQDSSSSGCQSELGVVGVQQRPPVMIGVYSNAADSLLASTRFEGASGTKEFNEPVILHVLNTWRCDPSLLIARLVLNLWHPALLSLSEVSTHSQYVFLYTLREM